jgi:gliding motility-associated-like protein
LTKKIFILLLIILGALFCKAQVNLQNGLKLHLPFNGNALDASGNNNNATVNGAILTTDAFGNANSAYFFDGINDFLEISSSASLQCTDSISLCARVLVQGFYNGTCQSNCIIQKGNTDFINGAYTLRFGDAPYDNNCNLFNPNFQTFYGHLKSLGNFPAGTGAMQAGAPPYITTTQWVCVAYIWDGDTIRLYVDGLLRFKYEYNVHPNGTNTNNLFIGKRNDANYPFLFNGKMDDVRIYNRAINEAEINALCLNCNYLNNITNFITTADTTICKNANLPITTITSLPNNTTYNWTSLGTITNTTSATPTITANLAATYFVAITDSNGCQAKDSVKINIHALPIANAGADKSICLGTTTYAIINGTGGGTYSWQPLTGLNSSTLQAPTATPNNTTNYTLTVTNNNNCTSTDIVVVTVTNPPIINVSSNGFDTMCIGAQKQLFAAGATTYNWQPSASLDNNTNATVIAKPNATTIYTITAADNFGCSTTTTLQLQVMALPIIAITGNNQICKNNSTILSYNGADTYLWQPSNGLTPLGNGVIKASPIATTTYTLIGSDAWACSNSKTFAIQVDEIPQLQIQKSNDINCQNKQCTLMASGAKNYIWTPNNFLNTNDAPTVIATPISNITYTVTGVNGACETTDTIAINVTSKLPVQLFVPNAISPNDDDLNDCFKPKIIGKFDVYHLKIFNRWGQMVFESNAPEQCWYGEANGKVLSLIETYQYILTIDDGCTPIKKAGDITLVK